MPNWDFNVQLILEQHKFKLHRSTYSQIFSINIYYSTTGSAVG